MNKIREFSDPNVIIALVANKSDLVDEDDRAKGYGKYSHNQKRIEEDNLARMRRALEGKSTKNTYFVQKQQPLMQINNISMYEGGDSEENDGNQNEFAPKSRN